MVPVPVSSAFAFTCTIGSLSRPVGGQPFAALTVHHSRHRRKTTNKDTAGHCAARLYMFEMVSWMFWSMPAASDGGNVG